jgi:hypothetical protein
MGTPAVPAAATTPPWAYAGMGSCEHVVEAKSTYGAEIAGKVPAAYRSTARALRGV